MATTFQRGWSLTSVVRVCKSSRYVPDILEMLKKGKMEPLVPIPTISMVQAVCRLLEGLLPALHDKTSEVGQ